MLDKDVINQVVDVAGGEVENVVQTPAGDAVAGQTIQDEDCVLQLILRDQWAEDATHSKVADMLYYLDSSAVVGWPIPDESCILQAVLDGGER